MGLFFKVVLKQLWFNQISLKLFRYPEPVHSKFIIIQLLFYILVKNGSYILPVTLLVLVVKEENRRKQKTVSITSSGSTSSSVLCVVLARIVAMAVILADYVVLCFLLSTYMLNKTRKNHLKLITFLKSGSHIHYK